MQKARFAAQAALLAIWSVIASFSPAWADESALAKAIVEANSTGAETPRVSVLDPAIDLDGAYRVQQGVVDHMLEDDGNVAGYKAGLTGKLARWWFDIDAPVFGVILTSAVRKSGDTIAEPKGRDMLLETEIAFVAGSRIDKPLADIAALKPLIRGIAPVIEAPAAGFPKNQVRKLTVTDIVANNVSAHILIAGDEQPAEGIDLTKLAATMTRDGATVSKGSGADVMGNPWESALWLVNVAIKQGRVIEPGHYLATGVIGKRVESEPGRYVADFGKLGKIEFTVE